MDIQKELQSLGFNKNEAEVYLALYKKGSAKAGEIIKLTKIHRNLVYQSLERLVEKGFAVQVIKGKVSQFEAVDPQRLIEHFEHQKNQAQQIIEVLHKEREHESRDIRVYDGSTGMIQARRQSLELKSGDTVYSLGTLPVQLGPEFEGEWDTYHEEREKKGIAFRALYERTTSLEHMAKRMSQPLVSARHLPFTMKSPIRFESFGDILTIGLPQSGPLVFSLRSKEAAEGFRQYFEYLWNQEVIVEQGIPAIKKAFYDMLGELEEGEEYCVIGASEIFQQMTSPFFQEYHRARIVKKVRVRMLTHVNSLERVRANSSAAGDPDGIMSEFHIMKTGLSLPIQINLYRKKTILIVYGKNPCIMRFDRADVHDLFQQYFDELWEQKTQTLKGFTGIKELCQKVCMEKNDLYLIAANGHLLRDYPDYYREFTKERVARSVKIHALAIEKVKDTSFALLPLAEFRYLPKGFESPMVIWIFGNTVAHVLFNKPETVFLIEDNNMANHYRQYYKALYQLSKVS